MEHLLDEEMLETLTYERSRTWANFIKTCEETDYGEEVPLNKLEELHEAENEENLDEIEEAEEDDVEDDIKNTTMTMSKAELTLMLTSGDNKEILNQTLPIVEEHVRKWKEAGLDRILNTFDPQKIEHHVGNWLRRNNSAYGDRALIQPSPSKSCHKRHKTKSGVDIYSPIESDDSETESMHSVDTARYIRESRKCTVSTSSKCNSPMMTIKTYRTVPRMRAELRAKYGCDELNKEKEHHHMQALLHRRDQRIRDHERKPRYHSMHYPYGHDLNLNGTHRRKHLRKRRDVSIMYSSSSSSEDDRRDSRCMCSPCVRRTISQTVHPYYAYRSYQSHSQSYRDYHHKRLESGSRSIHSTLSYKRSVCKMRRQHAFDNDIRPRLLENECKCCNNDRLCSKVVHIANSSTEEWFVQNESSPDHLIEMPKTRFSPAIRSDFKSQGNQQKQIKDKQRSVDLHESLSSSEDEEETTKHIKPVLSIKKNVSENKNKTSIPSVKFTHAEIMSPKKQVRKQKQTPKADPEEPITTYESIPKTVLPNCLPPVIEEEGKEPNAGDVVKVKGGQKVLDHKHTSKVSKETMKKKRPEKQEKIVDKIETPIKKSIPKTVPSSCLPAVVEDEGIEPIAVDVEKGKDTQKVLGQEKTSKTLRSKGKILSKKRIEKQEKIVDKTATTKKKKYKRISTKSDESGESDNELIEALEISRKTYIEEQEKIRQQENTSNITSEASTSLQLPEKSSFSNQSVACNSTTVFNRTDKPRSQNPIQVATIIELSSSDNSVAEQGRRTKIHSKRDVDCTLVTSTTGCEEAAKQSETTVVTQRSDIKITKNGILLYAPKQVATGKQAHQNYTLTEQSLSPIIGERRARRFLKYHVGSRSFESRYSVYYRPTARVVAMLSGESKSLDLDSSSSSGSDVDIFEQVDRYGVVYTVLEKHNEGD